MAKNIFLFLFSFLLIFSIESYIEQSKNSEESVKFARGNVFCKFIESIFAFSQKSNGHGFLNKNDSNFEVFKTVVELVSQRLDLAQPVALYKWQNNQSIDDPVREAALLANVASQANATGLSAEFAEEFFQDQINGSKIIQFAYFALWQANGAPNVTAPDLTTVTRPLINNVTSALINALVPVQTLREDKKCKFEVSMGIKELANENEINTNTEANRPKAICVGLAHLCAN